MIELQRNHCENHIPPSHVMNAFLFSISKNFK
uniref:Uncharacterized protein n=1 Tax=Arundo donax TaxID=35708 RepID=A0A0A9EKE3_ARUDO